LTGVRQIARDWILRYGHPKLISFLRAARRYLHLAYRIVIPTQRGGWPRIPAADHRVAAAIWFKFLTTDQYFGRLQFYQSFEPLGLAGQRPTEERARLYGFDTLIGPASRVLDVGSNMGCISLEAARRAREVIGIEINEDLLWIAEKLRKHVGVANVRFLRMSFDRFEDVERFDLILASAVRRWIGMPIDAFAVRIKSLLKPGGVLLFESNNYRDLAEEFEAEVQAIVGAGFEAVNSGTTHFDALRKFYALRRIT